MGLEKQVQMVLESFPSYPTYDSPILKIKIKPNKSIDFSDGWIRVIGSRDWAVDPMIAKPFEEAYRTYVTENGGKISEDFSIPKLNKDQLAILYGQTTLTNRVFLSNKKIKFPYAVFMRAIGESK